MHPDLKEFRIVTRRFLERSYELFPQAASELGLHQYDGDLGRNDAETHRAYVELVAEALAASENLAEHGFRGDDWLDRRAFLAHLRTELLFHSKLERWRNNPQIHCETAVQSIFGLVVRNAGNLRKATPQIESRLKKLPAFLEEGAACIRKPAPLWTRLAVQVCEGADEFLREVERAVAPLSTRRTNCRKLFEEARGAFSNYARAIERKKPGSPNSFSVGRENFEMLIRERLGLNWSLAEAKAAGYRLISQLEQEVRKEARKFGRGTVREIIDRTAAEWTPSRGTLLEEYRHATLAMREAFEKADIVTFPSSEQLKVLPVPEFLRHQFPTAAYMNPGPYERRQTGIFWVNDLSQLRETQEEKRREIRQHFGVELTAAHEAYPGHHLQFVTQNRHPSKLRRLFAHSIYYEGWTLWCETMCVEHGIYDAPHARLMQLHDALWRAWRIVIDCGLHSGELSFRAACRLLQDGVGFTAARAAGDVNWYTSQPTVPMSYLLGRLELEKLHDEITAARGWTLKQFNDWILSFGALPWSWIWQSVLHGARLPR